MYQAVKAAVPTFVSLQYTCLTVQELLGDLYVQFMALLKQHEPIYFNWLNLIQGQFSGHAHFNDFSGDMGVRRR